MRAGGASNAARSQARTRSQDIDIFAGAGMRRLRTEVHDSGRLTTSTGRVEILSNFSAVLPRKKRSTPLRP